MKRATLSTALYVSLVFLSGAVVGGFAHRLYMVNTVLSGPVSPKPEDVRRKIVEEMRTRLSLTNDQVTQLSAIMDSTKARFHEVRSKWDKEAHIRAKPELKAIQEDQVQKIKEILTEQQRPEYDKYRADREKQRQQTNSKPEPHRQD
jgi:hypothetical protein